MPLEWAADAISSSVLEDVDTGASNLDHYPVMLVLESVAFSCGQGVDPFISRIHLDGAKLTDAACRKAFSDETRCHHLCKTLSEAACTAFAKRRQAETTVHHWAHMALGVVSKMAVEEHKGARQSWRLACGCAFGGLAIHEQFLP